MRRDCFADIEHWRDFCHLLRLARRYYFLPFEPDLVERIRTSKKAYKKAWPAERRERYRIKVSFDPFDRGEINRIHDMLATIGIELVVSEVPEQLVRVSVPAGDQPVGGVLFRPGVPFDITVTWASAAKVANRTLVFVPDPQSTIAFEASRKAFVKKSTDLTFTNGMLTKSSNDSYTGAAGDELERATMLVPGCDAKLDHRRPSVDGYRCSRWVIRERVGE